MESYPPPLDLPDCGAPQGSVGGSLLWLMFTCNQPDVVHDHPIDGVDLYRGCPSMSGAHTEQVGCGELVGNVDDGAYAFAHRNTEIVSTVLEEKYDRLES